MKEQRRLGQLLTSGITIVFSILLALGLEAAWNYRGDRLREDRLLEAFGHEFADAATEIRNDLDARREAIEHLETLQSSQSEGGLGTDETGIVIDALLEWRIYTPSHPVFDAAVDTERFRVIRSERLRTALAAYEQERRRLEVFDARERDFVANELEPHLVNRIALAPILDGTGSAEEVRRLADLLRTDDTLAGLAALKRQRAEDASVYSRAVLRRIEAVLGALEEL